MDSSSLSPDLGRRLEQLDREIHSGLDQVRRHLKALEAAEKKAGGAQGSRPFADLLRESMNPVSPPGRPR